ncbi:hypothetical protein ACLOJK_019628 [Asimina triloba]
MIWVVNLVGPIIIYDHVLVAGDAADGCLLIGDEAALFVIEEDGFRSRWDRWSAITGIEEEDDVAPLLCLPLTLLPLPWLETKEKGRRLLASLGLAINTGDELRSNWIRDARLVIPMSI